MGYRELNCWEYMHCERCPGGKKVDEFGLCPAATDGTFDDFNRGINSGRMCWLIAGTFCTGKVQGTYAEKHKSCRNCDFYKQVHADGGSTALRENHVNVSAHTHVGLVRKVNEDRYLIKKLDDDTLLMAVADGLGGEVAGDYAAEIVRGKLAGLASVPVGEEEQTLARLAQSTDILIYDQAQKDASLEGMGTTLVCVLLRNGIAHWVHAGDSRIYIFREQQLTQVTEDQTFARFLIEEGEITPEQAPTHYSRHIMDQCVGCGICEPETGHFELMKNDLLILSTDGLHKAVKAEVLTSLLKSESDIERKAIMLVQAALDTGGDDNITVVLSQIV